MDTFLKSKDILKKSKALVAVSGGTSLALVKLLSQEQHSFAFKEYFSVFNFIHIEEEGLITRTSNLSYIQEKINEMFPESSFFSINLRNYILNSADNVKLFWDKESDAVLASQISGKSIHSIDDLLLSSLSPTSRIDILKCLRNNIIYDFAEKGEYSVIILGDTTTSIASKIISETAKGRGYSIPWETRGKIKYSDNIWLLRPMKDIIKQEAHFFLQINGIEIEIKKFDHKITTIDELADQYFDNLEKSNPNFVFTVVKTATKLQIPEIEKTKDQNSNFCFICQMPKENNIKDWIKKITIDRIDTKNVSNINTDYNCHDYNNKTEDICYGCLSMLKGLKSHIVFPYTKLRNINEIRNPKNEVLNKYLIE
ncbi:uncharacterized protein T551_00082 [Pneumocystis jirovecii RU7]|uniref:Cytoplasmic tRNA 2-thiolation protein 2 n=1 Tax=Pneumocystis jirovecii (strain RU7) TaxID=1408657 RepID=A0A0W4ZW52_PNEJ7|nr:uncharacterized protein T551_00082 [Pneumocystis jirovecii RU7]KTW32597.1 hypothetical protein T551_00082 [Pneumocystis jirovecii RU7]